MIGEIFMQYSVDFIWDDEASVWVATSNDVIGLVLESEQLEDLMQKVKNAVPELLELNNQRPASTVKCNIQERQLVYA